MLGTLSGASGGKPTDHLRSQATKLALPREKVDEHVVVNAPLLNDELDVRMVLLQPLRNTDNIIVHDLPLARGDEYMVDKPADAFEPVLRRLRRLRERVVGFGIALEQLRAVGPEYPFVQEVDPVELLEGFTVGGERRPRGEEPQRSERASRANLWDASMRMQHVGQDLQDKIAPAESPAT